MAKMSIGSGGPSKKQSQKEQAIVTEFYDDSQIKQRLDMLEAREPQIVEIRTVETIVEKQPEVTQHIHNVQEVKDIDLSHLLLVDRYEAEFKMLNQTVNVINQSLQNVANNSSASLDKLDNKIEENLITTKNLEKNYNQICEDFSDLNDIKFIKIEELENKHDIMEVNLIDFQDSIFNKIDEIKDVINKHDVNFIEHKIETNKVKIEITEKLYKKLKIQKIINVILAIGLAISLIK